MKSAIFATLLASAAAFAPSAQEGRATSALAAEKPFSDALGAMTPVSNLSSLFRRTSDKLNFVPVADVLLVYWGFLRGRDNSAWMLILELVQPSFCKRSDFDLAWYNDHLHCQQFLTPFVLFIQNFQLGLFDPLGLVSDGNQAKFDALRERELKHGRISMLAVVGYLVTAAGIRFPGAENIPDGLKAFPALMETSDGMNVLYQMAAFFTVAEIVNRDADWLDNEAEFVGDYRNGALDFGWDSFDEATKLRKRTIELNNGKFLRCEDPFNAYVHFFFLYSEHSFS